MKAILALLVVVGAALASTGVGSTSQPLLLAEVGHGSATRLAVVDPLTLAPAGRSTQIGRYIWPWARSPDGSRVALVRDPGGVRIVDLKRMRTVGAFQLRGSTVDEIAWVKPRLILAVVGGFSVVAVDPVTRRVVWRRALPNQLERVESAPFGFAILVRVGEFPATDIGPTALLSVDADGKLRSVVLDRIRSGGPDFTSTPPVAELRRPGLAVDPAGRQAYVVGAGEPVAEVDLAAMAVTYHGGSRVLAKAVNGPDREATWVGNGVIAVTGADGHAVITKKDGQEEEHFWYTPAGLSLVDTKDWSWKAVDRDATSVVVAGDLLLASAWIYDSIGPTVTGIGVAAYGLDGSPRFHVLDGEVVDVRAAAGLIYASGKAVSVVDSGSGRVLNTVPRTDLFPLAGF